MFFIIIIRYFIWFFNSFFNTQQAFAFHLLVDFLHRLRRYWCFFLFFFFRKTDQFYKLSFLVFLYYLTNIYWIFKQFYITNKNYKKTLEDIKMLQVNFIMVCTIHKILVLLEITRTLKCFWSSVIDFYLFWKK